MTDGVKLVHLDVAGLAGTVLTESQHLAEAMLLAQDRLPAPAAAFGNSSAASLAYEACQRAVEATGEAAGLLTGVLEDDVDRLYQVAFALVAADEESASGFTGADDPLGSGSG